MKEWIEKSNKPPICDLCGYKFTFTKIYSQDLPQDSSDLLIRAISLFFKKLFYKHIPAFIKVITGIILWLHFPLILKEMLSLSLHLSDTLIINPRPPEFRTRPYNLPLVAYHESQVSFSSSINNMLPIFVAFFDSAIYYLSEHSFFSPVWAKLYSHTISSTLPIKQITSSQYLNILLNPLFTKKNYTHFLEGIAILSGYVLVYLAVSLLKWSLQTELDRIIQNNDTTLSKFLGVDKLENEFHMERLNEILKTTLAAKRPADALRPQFQAQPPIESSDEEENENEETGDEISDTEADDNLLRLANIQRRHVFLRDLPEDEIDYSPLSREAKIALDYLRRIDYQGEITIEALQSVDPLEPFDFETDVNYLKTVAKNQEPIHQPRRLEQRPNEELPIQFGNRHRRDEIAFQFGQNNQEGNGFHWGAIEDADDIFNHQQRMDNNNIPNLGRLRNNNDNDFAANRNENLLDQIIQAQLAADRNENPLNANAAAVAAALDEEEEEEPLELNEIRDIIALLGINGSFVNLISKLMVAVCFSVVLNTGFVCLPYLIGGCLLSGLGFLLVASLEYLIYWGNKLADYILAFFCSIASAVLSSQTQKFQALRQSFLLDAKTTQLHFSLLWKFLRISVYPHSQGPYMIGFLVSLGVAAVITIGYFMAYHYPRFATTLRGKKLEIQLIKNLRIVGLGVKIILITGIEMIIFPMACGTLLVLALLPLHPTATVMDVANFAISNSRIFPLLVWFLGTLYMIKFAVYVNMCRGILRPGVLYFIKDPNDPNLHPIGDIIQRTLTFQLGRIGISAIAYFILIVVCIGSVVWSMRYIFHASVIPFQLSDLSGTIPLFITIPLSTIFLLPFNLVFKHFKPAVIIKRAWTAVFRRCCHSLRLSSFLLNSPVPKERGTVHYGSFYAWLTNVQPDYSSPKTEEDLANIKPNEAMFVLDGHFVRAPNSDTSAHKNLKLFIPVNKDDERIDGKTDEQEEEETKKLIEQRALANGEEVKHEGPYRMTNYFVVYRPPHFRMRVFGFFMFIWGFSFLMVYWVTAVPVLLGSKYVDFAIYLSSKSLSKPLEIPENTVNTPLQFLLGFPSIILITQLIFEHETIGKMFNTFKTLGLRGFSDVLLIPYKFHHNLLLSWSKVIASYASIFYFYLLVCPVWIAFPTAYYFADVVQYFFSVAMSPFINYSVLDAVTASYESGNATLALNSTSSSSSTGALLLAHVISGTQNSTTAVEAIQKYSSFLKYSAFPIHPIVYDKHFEFSVFQLSVFTGTIALFYFFLSITCSSVSPFFSKFMRNVFTNERQVRQVANYMELMQPETLYDMLVADKLIQPGEPIPVRVQYTLLNPNVKYALIKHTVPCVLYGALNLIIFEFIRIIFYLLMIFFTPGRFDNLSIPFLSHFWHFNPIYTAYFSVMSLIGSKRLNNFISQSSSSSSLSSSSSSSFWSQLPSKEVQPSQFYFHHLFKFGSTKPTVLFTSYLILPFIAVLIIKLIITLLYQELRDEEFLIGEVLENLPTENNNNKEEEEVKI